jgi:hypothetical protein
VLDIEHPGLKGSAREAAEDHDLECFAASVNLPAVASAWASVVSLRSSYLPGFPTWVETRKKACRIRRKW